MNRITTKLINLSASLPPGSSTPKKRYCVFQLHAHQPWPNISKVGPSTQNLLLSLFNSELRIIKSKEDPAFFRNFFPELLEEKEEFLFRKVHTWADVLFYKSYRPTITLLRILAEDALPVKITLHWPMMLLEYIKDKHPQTFEELRDLVDRDIVRLSSGAAYEAMISRIPLPDALAQISIQNRYIIEEFGRNNPHPIEGLWNTERIFDGEETLKRVLCEDLWLSDKLFSKEEPSGDKAVEGSMIVKPSQVWIPMDSWIFRVSGRHGSLLGYFLYPGENGAGLPLLPINEWMRYNFPFKLSEPIIKYILSTSPGSGIFYHDDTEKAGGWTDMMTFKNMEATFRNILTHPEIEMVYGSDYIEKNPPLSEEKILPATYHEHFGWHIPNPVLQRFIERAFHEKDFPEIIAPWVKKMGGLDWNRWLDKYPPALAMYKYMGFVSHKVNNIPTRTTKEKEVEKSAQRELFLGQVNDSFWHGLFSGVYDAGGRADIFVHLTKADNLADAAIKPDWSKIKYQRENILGNEGQEIMIDTPGANILISEQGGVIYWLIDKQRGINWGVGGNMESRNEAYHLTAHLAITQQEAKAMGESKKTIHERRPTLIEDLILKEVLAHLRTPHYQPAFLSRISFVPRDISQKTWYRQEYREYSRFDFPAGKWKAAVLEQTETYLNLLLSKKGEIKKNGKSIPLEVVKNMIITHTPHISIEESYLITNLSKENRIDDVEAAFETNIPAILQGNSSSISSTILESSRLLDRQEEDGFLQKYSEEVRIYLTPVKTVHLTDRGLGLTLQHKNIMAFSLLELEPGERKEFSLVSELSGSNLACQDT